jgi:hypothetical protein
MLNLLSSNSFSMLPSEPKIFHGRESELKHVIEALMQDSPRVAILGGGGMGKTSLARAALHHPDVANKFEHRYFVSAESATNSIELAAQIGLHLGLNPGKDVTKPVIQFFSTKPPCLLILDNLETPWEPIHSHAGVEEFLSLLTDIPHLALLVSRQHFFWLSMLISKRSRCGGHKDQQKWHGLVLFCCLSNLCQTMLPGKLSLTSPMVSPMMRT